jgi:hypothetical protein
MKFPFSKKNKKVQFSDETLKVKRVRVITKSAPKDNRKKSPTRGVSSVSVSSSPTGVKDQASVDYEESFVNSKSQSQKSQEYSADYSSFYSCGTSSCGSGSTECSYDNDVSSTSSNEVKKRWNDMKEIMTMKIEELHDSVDIQFQKFITGEGDFGRSAMIAVEKNRNDIDEMVIRIDEEAKNMDIATEIALAVDSTTTTAGAADGTSSCPAGCPIQVPFNYFQKYSNSTSSTNDNNKEGPHDENSTTNKIDSSLSSPFGSKIAACTGGVGNNAFVCDSVYQSTMTTCTDIDLGGCASTTSPCNTDDNSSNDIIIMVQLPNNSLR